MTVKSPSDKSLISTALLDTFSIMSSVSRGSKIDIAAKRRKKLKNKISGLVISVFYNEQKSKF